MVTNFYTSDIEDESYIKLYTKLKKAIAEDHAYYTGALSGRFSAYITKDSV